MCVASTCSCSTSWFFHHSLLSLSSVNLLGSRLFGEKPTSIVLGLRHFYEVPVESASQKCPSLVRRTFL